MTTFLILTALVLAQITGDYFVKLASAEVNGISTLNFSIGVLFYAATAFGWYFLMRMHSLATIGVLYSTSTIVLLAALGYFVFKEEIGLRDIIGMTLAILSVMVMSHGT